LEKLQKEEGEAGRQKNFTVYSLHCAVLGNYSRNWRFIMGKTLCL